MPSLVPPPFARLTHAIRKEKKAKAAKVEAPEVEAPEVKAQEVKEPEVEAPAEEKKNTKDKKDKKDKTEKKERLAGTKRKNPSSDSSPSKKKSSGPTPDSAASDGDAASPDAREVKERVPWTAEEDARLIALVKSLPAKQWMLIAKLHGGKTKTKRHHNDVRKRWTTVLDPSLTKGEWSKEEDESLIALVAKHGADKFWNTKIQEELVGGNRTGAQCKMRWTCSLNPALAKGDWSQEEDESLVELVEASLEEKPEEPITLSGWAKIAKEKKGGSRTNKQCKRRWTKNLDPKREEKGGDKEAKE